jgi:hypothetical protein
VRVTVRARVRSARCRLAACNSFRKEARAPTTKNKWKEMESSDLVCEATCHVGVCDVCGS